MKKTAQMIGFGKNTITLENGTLTVTVKKGKKESPLVKDEDGDYVLECTEQNESGYETGKGYGFNDEALMPLFAEPEAAAEPTKAERRKALKAEGVRLHKAFEEATMSRVDALDAAEPDEALIASTLAARNEAKSALDAYKAGYDSALDAINNEEEIIVLTPEQEAAKLAYEEAVKTEEAAKAATIAAKEAAIKLGVTFPGGGKGKGNGNRITFEQSQEIRRIYAEKTKAGEKSSEVLNMLSGIYDIAKGAIENHVLYISGKPSLNDTNFIEHTPMTNKVYTAKWKLPYAENYKGEGVEKYGGVEAREKFLAANPKFAR